MTGALHIVVMTRGWGGGGGGGEKGRIGGNATEDEIDSTATATFRVGGMSCAICAGGIAIAPIRDWRDHRGGGTTHILVVE
jgi:hypothetical protein